MSNRVLRNYKNSEKVDLLSWQAECLFMRLITEADDYGSFYANAKIIKANCFPLRTDSITSSEVEDWINELVNAEIVKRYSQNGKEYLRIIDFGQRVRNMRNKFPDPQQVAANGGESPQAAASRPSNKQKLETETRNKLETETNPEKSFLETGEKFLVPEMLIEWKKIFKTYPEKKEKDFPALRQIALFIAEKQDIDCDPGIMPLFRQLSEYISRHDFYKNYSLQQVSNHIQDIVININNEKSTTKGRKHPTGKSLREQVNEAFVKRYPQ